MLPDTDGMGFEWSLENVERDKTDLGKVPIPVVTDVLVFNERFPNRVLAALNGQSIRVGAQRVGRDMRWKTSGIDSGIIGESVLAWLRGLPARRASVVVTEVRIYIATDGTEFNNKEECMAHELSIN